MIPQPMPVSEPHENDPNSGTESPAYPDLASAFKQHVLDGLSPELALDLALNELVVRATSATRASGAALALKRGTEMVCRATTGEHAPDLGVPLSTREGLSGACLRSRQPQLCRDTETDSRVDAAAARRLGVRSTLIVPVTDGDDVAGVLEVFSPHPGAFSESHQTLLERFARDGARLRQLALELAQAPPKPTQPLKELGSEVETRLAALLDRVPALSGESLESAGPLSPAGGSSVPAMDSLPPQGSSSGTNSWVLILGTLVIAAAAALSFMIGSRLGWMRSFTPPRSQTATPKAASTSGNQANLSTPPAEPGGSPRLPSAAPPAAPAGGLVVYERGKVIFRMKTPASPRAAVGANGSTMARSASSARAWLAPDAAEKRLLYRLEPQYPADALAAHRSGDVVLEVLVGKDGSVASTRTMSGDPLLAGASADAVRKWRYEPYRVHGHPAEFQTEVMLKFALPN